MVVVPETESVVTPVMVSAVPSPKTALPVIVSALLPPVTVPFVVMVEPVRVRSPPLKVTAPVYVCVLEVVTLAPKSLVVETLSEVALVIAALRSRAPVILIAPNGFVAPTVSAVLSPMTSVPVPKLKVRSRGVPPSLLSVSLKVTLLFVVVSVVFAPSVTASL